MTESLPAVLRELMKLRVNFVRRETDLYAAVFRAFIGAGFAFHSQVDLGAAGRIDYLVAPGIGIEVKAGRPPTLSTIEQLERYASSERIDELILVTEAGIPGLPVVVNGKPLHQVALRQLWGIAS